MRKKRLGEILLEEGLITKSQLEGALEEKSRWGGRIGQHLANMGAISAEALQKVLSDQMGVAKIDLKKTTIGLDALEVVPKAVCQKHILIPIAKKLQGHQKRLLVAMSDPMNLDAVREVEFVSNCVVSAVFALESDISLAIDYCYHLDGLRESRGLEICITPIEMDEIKHEVSPVIYTQEGKEMMVGMESRGSDFALRALLDLLVEKGIITLDEFRSRMEKLKQDKY